MALPVAQDKPTREFIISLLSGEFKKQVELLPEELAAKSDQELFSLRTPTKIDFFLRKNLWKQIELVQKGFKTDINPIDIYRGICSQQAFDIAIKVPLRLAYLLTSPTASHDIMDHALQLGLMQIIDFMSQPMTKETSGAFLKAFEILLNRVEGPIIQKIQAQHAHLNLNKPLASSPDDRLKQLKDKLEEREVEQIVSAEEATTNTSGD